MFLEGGSQREKKSNLAFGASPDLVQINPETVAAKQEKVVLPKGSCRMKLKACHIDSDDYADYSSSFGL